MCLPPGELLELWDLYIHVPTKPLRHISTNVEWLWSSGRRAERIFGCLHYGGAEADVHRNGPWGHYFILRCQAVADCRQLASNLLKYRSCDIDIRPIFWFTADPYVKFQTDFRTMSISRFEISWNLRIRHRNSILNRASTGRVVMLMKTKL